MFIEHQSHSYSEIKPERNWHSFKPSSSTNDHHGKQDKYDSKPDTYNQYKNYLHDRKTQ